MLELRAKKIGLISTKKLKIGTFCADIFRLIHYTLGHCLLLLRKFPPTHFVYQALAVDFVSKHKPQIILKTDLWNEVETNYPIASMFKDVYCIELSESRVEKAKKKFPSVKCINGDIVKLPFKNNTFDAILEFSTIDHIENERGVLSEYFRVLNTDGVMLLVVWLKSGKQKKIVKNFGSDALVQMYFDDASFVTEISSKFDIQDEGFFMQNAGIRYLAWFVLKKRSLNQEERQLD